MTQTLRSAALGVAAAIAITTAMDATGYSVFSALPLFPLAGLFWYLQKFSRHDIGLVWGDLRTYVLALVYPMLLLGLIGIIAWLFSAVDTSNADWNKAILNMALMSSAGVVMVLITEEGFFRGWLWAALSRAGQSDKQVLIWTSIAFTLWHISAISLDTGFDIPAAEIPVYLINATLSVLYSACYAWRQVRSLRQVFAMPSGMASTIRYTALVKRSARSESRRHISMAPRSGCWALASI